MHNIFYKIVLGIFSVMLLTFLITCKSSIESQKNVAYLYANTTETQVLPSKIYHISASQSRLFLDVPKDLIYFDSTEVANILVTTRLSSDFKAQKLLWTVTDTFAVRNKTGDVIYKQILDIAEGNDYYLHISLSSPLQPRVLNKTINVYKSDAYNDQNYLLTNAQGTLLFNSYASVGTRLWVHYRGNTKAENALYKGNRYVQEYLPALPPFITDKNRPLPSQPDSTWEFNKSFTLTNEALYTFRASNTIKGGISVISVSGDYPKLTHIESLIGALRYITRNEEYENLIQAKSNGEKAAKSAIDDFWLARAGSFDRGKVLIKTFYSRVQNANSYFSTYQEGWKSDRGVLYIIYGPPNEVYKTSYGERWVYTQLDLLDRMPLSFNFTQVSNDFSSQHYQLYRQAYYEMSWHECVGAWRKGIIKNVR